MSFCTELDAGERCLGCPLSEKKEEVLEPYKEARVTIEVKNLLGEQDFEGTQDEYIDELTNTITGLEPAYSDMGWLMVEIANWRMVGACEYHDGPVIDDSEIIARLETQLASKGE